MTLTSSDITRSPIEIPKRGMPVTIITGFLGSGKTTLVNQILSNRQDLKVAVLVNEFGDIDIDSQLLVSIDEEMVQLSNGCICCTINDDLVQAVYNVLENSDRIDYMVIETTGIADPLPIMLTFLGTELRNLTHLDSVITLVDASEFTPEHFDSQAALKQIAYGDIILLNKTDLIAVEKVEELEGHIRAMKEKPRMMRCQNGKVPLPVILDVGYNNEESYADLVQEEIEKNQLDRHDPHHHDHSHDHHDHEHHHHHSDHLDNDGFVSVSYCSNRPFSLRKFEEFLDTLPPSVFRAKGLLWFTQSPHKHIFQLCGKRCTLNAEDWDNIAPSNKLVVIGRHINSEQIRNELALCEAS
ncbi:MULTISPECIES: GTP-binding protein [unclassified Roseofilum]|uniref:CobW family GTP-binding protein n=1 Tax=unclassified Roseofilum TaxID=2620099 RepID=UPI001B1CA347|nr:MULTISPECIES: GTP-binding protein [unclassified Roseofilum]MBP0009533.1 GTP-binding protein [Roseofilum sp. Belize Diploria]MBP0032736.1 GTP-binding protein [Roseofilum sp. Belize BBD 4]